LDDVGPEFQPKNLSMSNFRVISIFSPKKEEDEEEIADESDSENKVESEERENKDKEG